MGMRLVALLAAAVLVVAGCGDDDQSGDAGARLACRDFRQSAQDQVDGLLTPDELRSRMQDVEGNAKLSEVPGVADAGRDLLAAFTPPVASEADQSTVVEAFGQACESAGL